MGNLGDSFPKKLRNEFAQKNICIGSVIRVPVQDTTPPKIKRLIIVGIEEDNVLLATAFINSEININILNTPELTSLQYGLQTLNCDFIDRDSFVDCSIIKERKIQKLKEYISNNPNAVMGELEEKDLERIKGLLISATTIPIHLKKKYCLL